MQVNIRKIDDESNINLNEFIVEVGNNSKVKLMPIKNYNKCEKYTLWIKEVRSKTNNEIMSD